MPKNRNRHRKPVETSSPKSDWPSWFIAPAHPVEEELLRRVLHNKHLNDIHFTVHMMQINYIVFRKNYEELVKLHKEFDQPLIFNELALQTDKGKEIAQDTIIEFTRVLHNFLASAKMLIEVTRRWVRRQFEDSEFLDTYQKEVAKHFANNVQAQFLEDLRNFTLHRALPLSIPELRMDKVSEHTLKSSLGIVLLKDYLLEWKNWSELGKMQIGMAFEGDVDILLICKKYFDNVTEFTQWLFWQVRDLFSEEIDQINSVINDVRGRGK
jgi:hypothetical protein